MILTWRQNATGDWLASNDKGEWVGWCAHSSGQWHALTETETADARVLGVGDLADAKAAVFRHALGKPCICELEARATGRKTPFSCHQCGRDQHPRREPMARTRIAKKTAKKPAAEKPDNGKSKQQTECLLQTLRCPLDDTELLKRGDRAAHLLSERDEKQADLDNAKKQAKAEIDRLEAEHRALSGQVRDKAEYRSVECEKVYDWRRLQITVTRLDTGEVIAERPMDSVERERAQTALSLNEKQEDTPAVKFDTAEEALEALKDVAEKAGGKRPGQGSDPEGE